MFVICINKLALKFMKKKRNDFVANPIETYTEKMVACPIQFVGLWGTVQLISWHNQF